MVCVINIQENEINRLELGMDMTNSEDTEFGENEAENPFASNFLLTLFLHISLSQTLRQTLASSS